MADSSFRRLENLKDDATRLKNMLDEVSNLAQVTTDVSPERVDVPELVEEVKGELGMDLDDAEITVDSDFPEVKFDKFQLKVLLKNLIANGLKYNQEPKRVEVGYNLEPGSSKLVVLVKDDGKGIAQEHHDRVFRMFEQLEPEEAPTGTGAGLALCKRIVEGNNEKIWLDSDPGVGTAVGFTVPLFEREE
ncbi:HAMP domain-containing histidine kinase [Candidatus Bipolaricaulota bacterium]|nr:HAMP domain-containing histidine kinase [Candidatus Bipolaricaulota bacterium]